MFASSKAHKAPAAAGGVPFAELTQLNSGTTSYNQAGVLSDGRIVVALTNSGYMGFQIFNTNGSVSGSAYYYTGYANYLYGLAVDSSNNIYLGGSNYVMKCTTSGTVVWTITGFPSGFQNIGMMSCNGTQLAFTSSNRSASSGNYTYVFLFDTTTNPPTLLWSRQLTNGQRTELEQCNMDNSGNVYVGGLLGSYNAAMIKYNNSGTLLWQTSYGFDETGMSVDRVNSYSILNSYNSAAVRVFNSSGTCTAGCTPSPSNNSYTIRLCFVHSDGSFMWGGADPSTPTYIALVRCDASGNQSWNKKYKFNSMTGLNAATMICSGLDSNGNYIISGSATDTSTKGLLFTVNPSTGVVVSGSATWSEVTPSSYTYTKTTTITPGVTSATSTTYTPSLTYPSPVTLTTGTTTITTQA